MITTTLANNTSPLWVDCSSVSIGAWPLTLTNNNFGYQYNQGDNGSTVPVGISYGLGSKHITQSTVSSSSFIFNESAFIPAGAIMIFSNFASGAYTTPVTIGSDTVSFTNGTAVIGYRNVANTAWTTNQVAPVQSSVINATTANVGTINMVH
jgi:hypothetical protein